MKHHIWPESVAVGELAMGLAARGATTSWVHQSKQPELYTVRHEPSL